MKKLLMRMAALLIVFTFVMLPETEAADGTAELVIFHTNDMHARVSPNDDKGESIGFANISAAVRTAKSTNPDTLWLDAGDTFHGMPIINISRGENMVMLLNESLIDAVAPGNHDYNYTAGRLLELNKMLKADILSANTVKKGTEKYIFKPYRIYKLANNIKVGVFGLTTMETVYKTNPKNVEKIDFLNPIDQAQKMVSKLRSKCDVVIAVTHIGLDGDSEFTSDMIAKAVHGIDLIVDGHSHTALPAGLTIDDTLIVQTGWHGHRLGCVKLSLHDHKITAKQAQLLTAEDVKTLAPTPDAAVEKTLNEIEQRNEHLFNEVIAHSDRILTSKRPIVRRHESELGNLSTDAFKWKTGADIAVTNGGGLRADLPVGDVTRGDIMAIFPFGNTVEMAEIKGDTIRAMLEHSVYAYPATFGGFLSVSGIKFSYDPTQIVYHRVSDIYIGDELLDDNKTYKIATIDFLFNGGDDYDMLKGLKIIGKYGSCEEVVAEYLNQVGMDGIEVGRITLLKEIDIPEEEDGSETIKSAA